MEGYFVVLANSFLTSPWISSKLLNRVVGIWVKISGLSHGVQHSSKVPSTFLWNALHGLPRHPGKALLYSHLCFFFLIGKNKRVGKQLASQKILQLLHPHVKNWGSLLRMYGRESSKMVKQVTRLSRLLAVVLLLFLALVWVLLSRSGSAELLLILTASAVL